ncbi:MAG TPA: Holliday junction resolvase RuvX [Negativicutes bacterium]|nr:Holliday junction resolvase RuvX [Negativicutes bacterium]
MRIMALDVGEKRIGVALSDELLVTAQGLCVINSKGEAKDTAYICELIKEHGVTHLVLGLPRNMNGSYGPMAEKMREFGQRLSEKQQGIVVEYWDERLTTSAAQRVLVDADMSRNRRRQVVDKVAAVLILQGYMDSIARKRSLVQP